MEIAVFCPPLAIHSMSYVYPVQSAERLIFKNPKSDDDCNRFAKSDGRISTGIDAYVRPLNARSKVPLAASDAVAKRVIVAL